MKAFLTDLKQVVEVHISSPALFWAGLTLISTFTVVGMIVSVRVWLPIVAILLAAILIAMAGRKHMDMMSPEREMLIRQVVSYVVSNDLAL